MKPDAFERMRERSPFISAIIKFQCGNAYPFLFALICAVSASLGKQVYVPCIAALTLLSVFAGLFSSDLKVFIVPAFMIYYSIGSDKPEDFYSNYYPGKYYQLFTDTRTIPSFDRSALRFFIVCLFVLALILLYKMMQKGVFKMMLSDRGMFFYGIIALDAALILNGIGGGAWSIGCLTYGLLSALVITVCYCLFYTIIKECENGISYVCITLVATSLCVLLQVLAVFVQLQRYDIFINPQFVTYDVINRHLFSTAWGLVTIVAAVIACGIPSAFYLVRNKKAPFICFLLALAFFASSIIVNTRSAMIFGGAALICGIICSLSGKNKRINRVMTLILAMIVIGFSSFVLIKVPEYIGAIIENLSLTLRLNFDTEEGMLPAMLGARYDIWVGGIKNFLSAPVFGVGFVSEGIEINRVYDHMCHNVVIEFLSSMGTVGILAFAFHLFAIFKLALKNFSANKLLLLGVPLCIIGMSLFDNFFFYPNFIIIYGAFLACAELYSEKEI